MLADIHAVVFDLDGTLLDRRRSFEWFVRDQWARFAHYLKSVPQEQYVQTLIEVDRDGYAPRKELFTVLNTCLRSRPISIDGSRCFGRRKLLPLW